MIIEISKKSEETLKRYKKMQKVLYKKNISDQMAINMIFELMSKAIDEKNKKLKEEFEKKQLSIF